MMWHDLDVFRHLLFEQADCDPNSVQQRNWVAREMYMQTLAPFVITNGTLKSEAYYTILLCCANH